MYLINHKQRKKIIIHIAIVLMSIILSLFITKNIDNNSEKFTEVKISFNDKIYNTTYIKQIISNLNFNDKNENCQIKNIKFDTVNLKIIVQRINKDENCQNFIKNNINDTTNNFKNNLIEDIKYIKEEKERKMLQEIIQNLNTEKYIILFKEYEINIKNEYVFLSLFLTFFLLIICIRKYFSYYL
jgi:hypothetical protein